jgi:hypothetical protein
VNVLELRLDTSDHAFGPEVRVLIDGRDLIELAREAEAASAEADDQPELAGGYRGLRPAWWRKLPEQDGDGRAVVLGCECGQPGCWPLRTRITIASDSVTWSDFQQPHRRHWRHDALGPFIFSRDAYEAAVSAIAGGPFVRDV